MTVRAIIQEAKTLTPGERADFLDALICMIGAKSDNEEHMETVHDSTPADRSQRDLSMWFDDAQQLNVWIHPPNSGNDAGWQVKVSREDFETALRALRIPRD